MEDDPNNCKEQPGAPAVTGSGPEPAPAGSEPDELKQKYDELNERYLRLAADFENFRKRTSREQERIIRHANEQLAIDMLDVVDSLERAVQSDDPHLREGLDQISKLCAGILQRYGITPIESLDTAFDPAQHEAIAHVPSKKGEGTVIGELSRGYRMHDKVIRYAKVAVSKGLENKNEE